MRLFLIFGVLFFILIPVVGNYPTNPSQTDIYYKPAPSAVPQEYYTGNVPIDIYPNRIITANFDNDGLNEIAFIQYNKVIIYDIQMGVIIAEIPKPSDFDYPVIKAADLTGDGIAEIIFAEKGSRIVVMDNAGTTLWNYKPYVATSYATDIVFVDLDLDGKLDIVQTSGDGTIYGYRGYDGVYIFQNFINMGLLVTVGNFNSTPGQEIFVSSTMYARILDKQGITQKLIDLEIISGGAYIYGNKLAIGNYSNDHFDDIVVSFTLEETVKTAYLRIIESGNGTVVWKHNQVNAENKAVASNYNSNPALRRLYVLTSESKILEYSDFSSNDSAATYNVPTNSLANDLRIPEFAAGQRYLVGIGYGGFIYDMGTHTVLKEYIGFTGLGELTGDGYADLIVINEGRITIYSSSPRTDPQSNSPDDIKVEIDGSAAIVWTITDIDTSSGIYSVVIDGKAYEGYTGLIWNSGVSFEVPVITSEAGSFEYKLQYTDGIWIKTDSVYVKVGDDEKPFIPGYPLIALLGFACCTLLVLSLRFRKLIH